MRCEDLRLEVDTHLAGELPQDLAETLRSHLVGCTACRDDAAWAETVRSALQRTRPEAPAVDPEALAAAVLAKDRGPSTKRPAARRKRTPQRRGFPWPALLAMAAVLLLGLGLALKLGAGSRPAPQASLPTDPSAPAPSDPEPPDGVESPSEDPGPDPDFDSEAQESEGGTLEPSADTPDGEADADAVDSEAPDTGDTESDQDPSAPSDPTDAGTGDAVEPPSRAGSETDPTPGSTIQAALASSVEGNAEVRSKGSEDWIPLAADARLAAGDRVRTGKGSLALLLSDDSLPADLSVEAGTWVRMPAKAEVLIAPDSADLEIARGACVVQTDRDLQIVAGAARLSAMGCEIMVAVNPQGRVNAALLSGRAAIYAGGKQDLAPGQQVTVDRRGKLGRVRKGAKPPRWLDSRRAPGEVLWDEPFDNLEQRNYTQYDGDCAAGIATATKRGESTKVNFGRSVADGGIYRHRIGARIRVRYRLSAAATLTLQVMNNTQRDNYHTIVARPRVGAWTEVVFRPDAFQDNERKGKRFADGDEVGYVSLVAKGDATLEVDEVVVYAP